MQTEDEKTEATVATARRDALRASLERERDGYKTRGLEDRARQVEEQLVLLDEGHDTGGQEPSDNETSGALAPLETAVESKPRSTAAASKARGPATGRAKQGE